jgi:formyl-CoA transferase
MAMTGEPDQPPTRTFAGFADQVSAFLLSYGIMVALFHRERTGEGQFVTGSLLQSMLGVQAFNVTSYLMTGTYGGSPIPRVPRGLTSPLWNHYKTSDNRWIMMGMPQVGRYWPPFQKALLEATGETIGPEEMSVDWIRLNAPDLIQLIQKIDAAFASQTAAYWSELFRKHDLLFEIVQDYREVAVDPQVEANDMIATLDHPQHGPLKIVAPAVSMTATPGTIRAPAPEFGQHTEEVLLEAGFDWEEIGSLREQGVIGHRGD